MRYKGNKVNYSRAWSRKNRSKIFIYYLRRKYNLSIVAYWALIQAGCGICGRGASQIDHDHKTGRVRGALCKRCNLGLGFFGDGTRLLKKALEYLNG